MANITLLIGSVHGAARLTGQAISKALSEAGHQVFAPEVPDLSDLARDDGPLLVCTSTTGQGEIPANLLPFYLRLRDNLPQYPGRPFGIIVLGDSSYATFCAAGDLMEEVLLETGSRKLGDSLRIDALETTEPEQQAVDWTLHWITKYNDVYTI